MIPDLDKIASWYDEGVSVGATHMLVVRDTFDEDHGPHYVAKDENVLEAIAQLDGRNMQQVVEVYDLRLNRETQLDSARRVWHVDAV